MSNHPQLFMVVGYCDSPDKSHGTGDITYFTEQQRLLISHIPSADRLRDYARRHGYEPEGVKCDPVYAVIGDGLEYTKCAECFRSEA